MSEPVHCEPPWNTTRSHHRPNEYARSPWEWMPRPFGGRVMLARNRKNGSDIYLQIVPGPEGLWQIVRVELATPVARGFKTREGARRWIARAVRAGVLPQGVTEVESADAK